MLRNGIVERLELLRHVDRLSGAGMVLLQAPAGYGKTVLMSQLAEHARAQGADTHLIALDAMDRDALHLAERLAVCHPALTVDMLRGGSGAAFQSFSPETPCVLFFDNAERIAGSDGERLVLRLLERAGLALRMVYATRVTPRFGVSRLELSGDLAILAAPDLCFDQSDVAALLSERQIDHDRATLAAFQQLTEGWPAAVQLACRTMMEEGLDLAGWLAGGSVVCSRIDRYFSEEILEGLTPQQAAVATVLAPVGRFTAKFARTLTGSKHPERIIAALEGHGLLSGLASDPFRQWHRFHPLLARFLERALEQDDPDRLLDVHRQAMEWSRTEGRLSDAVRHAFAAGERGAAAQLLEQASLERRRVGRPTPVADWSDSLSDKDFDRFPLLRTEAACAFATGFAVEAARMHADSVRRQFSDLSPMVRDDLFAVDALIAVYADQPEQLVEMAERGLRELEAHDPYTVGTLYLAKAMGLVASGKLDQARQAARRAQSENHRAANAFGIAVSHMVSGLVQAVAGDLAMAAGEWTSAEKAIRPVTRHGYVESIAIGYLPEVYYEWNRLQEAEAYLERCLAGPIEVMTPDMVTSAHLTAARVWAARANFTEAHRRLDALEVVAAERDWPRAACAAGWERVRLLLQSKDYQEARRRRQRMVEDAFAEQSGICTHALEMEAHVIGEMRFESLLSPNPAMFSCIQGAVSQALAGNRRWRAAKLLVIEAVARATAGDCAAAKRAMSSALKLGHSGGMVRTFIDEGPLAVSLIEQVASSAGGETDAFSADYLATLLEAAGSAVIPKMDAAPAMVEPLSDREMEVLRLIFHGCSNSDAADKLCVSQNTVKWHLQRIYSKLSVKNRTAAVAAARSLNLVH